MTRRPPFAPGTTLTVQDVADLIDHALLKPELTTDDVRSGVAELVDDALSQGARALVGGEVPAGKGWFYPPTVLTDVPSSARVLTEEIFGPVLSLIPHDGDDDAINAAFAALKNQGQPAGEETSSY